MRTFLIVLAIICVGVVSVAAEPITVSYTEPTASATLAFTTVYWCRGSACTNWTVASKQVSDNGNGGDAKSVSIQVPLTAGTLPVTIRVKVTATNTNQNESAGVADTITFTE